MRNNIDKTNNKGLVRGLVKIVTNLVIFFILLFALIFLYEVLFVGKSKDSSQNSTTYKIQPTRTVKAERVPVARVERRERELNAGELKTIKNQIKPTVDEHVSQINEIADRYSNEIKRVIIGKANRTEIFGEELFSIGNVLRFLKYWALGDSDKFNKQISLSSKKRRRKSLQSEWKTWTRWLKCC